MVIENIFLNSFHLRGSDYRKLQQLMQLYWKRLKPRGITKNQFNCTLGITELKKKNFFNHQQPKEPW